MSFSLAKKSLQGIVPRIQSFARPERYTLPHSLSKPFSASSATLFRPTNRGMPLPILTADGKKGVIDVHQNGIVFTQEQPSADKSEWSVEKTLKDNGIPNPSEPPTTPLPFLHVLTRLKTTPREGWRRMGIKDCESISDHMYRMAIITMLAPPSLSKRLNLARCTKMALVHDMAESLVGDITPVDKVAKSEKSRRESTTMDFLTSKLLGNSEEGKGLKEAGEDIKQVWQEYEDGVTAEAVFVHDVDKFELVVQMVEYERAGKRSIDLGEFFHVANKVQTPEVREWCVAVLKERMEFWGDEYADKNGILPAEQLLQKYLADGGNNFPEL